MTAARAAVSVETCVTLVGDLGAADDVGEREDGVASPGNTLAEVLIESGLRRVARPSTGEIIGVLSTENI